MDDLNPIPEKPSWGKTIGVFCLCYACAIAGAVFMSATIISGYGYSGYSYGGLGSLATGIIGAAIYRSKRAVFAVALGSLAVGVFLGWLAVQIALSM